MPTLVIKTVGGRELDRVTLYNGNLDFDTGAARDMFEGFEDPQVAFDQMNGWSNGYVVSEPAE